MKKLTSLVVLLVGIPILYASGRFFLKSPTDFWILTKDELIASVVLVCIATFVVIILELFFKATFASWWGPAIALSFSFSFVLSLFCGMSFTNTGATSPLWVTPGVIVGASDVVAGIVGLVTPQLRVSKSEA